MMLQKSLSIVILLIHLASAWNYGGGGGGWHDKIPSKIIVKHVPKHVPVYKPVPIPKPVAVPKPVGYLKPLAIAKPFRVPHVVPVIKHFQKPFPVVKGVPFHFPIPLPKLVKLPFQIKLPKPYIVRVPKPYAVPKKYPVAVPVHIPKPYIVPVLKPVPVAVPHKIPKIIPVLKEIPEYVKKPVPVYVEEKPYKHEHYNPDGNYKGTPYIGSNEESYKGTPFPSGIGTHKGTPFPSGLGDHKGTPYLEGLGVGNKGTPYIPSGKGSSGYHSKGTNVHATSAASFLEAHAGKLTGSQSGGGYDNILASYSHTQGQSGLQGYGGNIHGGLQGHPDLSSAYQSGYGTNLHESFGSYGSQGYGAHGYSGYDLHSLSSIGGYDAQGLYGRGIEGSKVQEGDNKVAEPNVYESGNVADGYDGGSNADESYEKQTNADHHNQSPKDNQENGNQDSAYNAPAYIGVSVTSYDDHSGRGGGYPENLNAGNYDTRLNYENHASENKDQSAGHGYQGYGATNTEYQSQDNRGTYAHQAQSPNYVQIPQLALYQIQNGAATAIHYPNHALQFYNAGYQAENTYQNQEDNSYANNQVGQGSYGQQNYQQQENTNEATVGNYQQQQQHPYAYQAHDNNYQGESYEKNQEYGNQQNQENVGYGHENQDVSYENQNGEAYNSQGAEGYRNQEAYSNQASEGYHNPQSSYQISQNNAGYQNEAAYNNQEVAPGLQHYGLRAAYPVQSGAENHNQVHGAAGPVYVRAYDNQGENQASYNIQNQEGYQTQDSQQQKTYAAYSVKSSTSSVSSTQQSDAQKQQTPALGRSYDSKGSEQIISSSGYSQPEGGDTKGGSWQAVQ